MRAPLFLVCPGFFCYFCEVFQANEKMVISYWLFVTVTLLLSVVISGFAVWFLMKIFPKSEASAENSTRGCVGIIVFFFLFFVLLFGITLSVPRSNVIIAGPDQEYSTENVMFYLPDSFKEKYNITDFEMGRNYIINITDRNMLLYNVRYGGIIPAITTDPHAQIYEIPAQSCTKVEPGCMPDYFFYEPGSIQVKKNESGIQYRWILDYSPINP